MMKSTEIIDEVWKSYGIPAPKREYKFHPTRRWRADFIWINEKVIVEIEGGLWNYGRHNRAASMIKDMEKYNAMTELGFKLLRYIPNKVDFKQVKKVIGENK